MSEQDKKLQKDNMQGNLQNSKLEQVMIKAQIVTTTKKRDMLVAFMDVRKKMHEKAMENYKYVNPTYAFQSDDEFMALQKQMAQLEFEMEASKQDANLQQLDAHLQSYADQLATLEESISKLESELVALGE